MTVWVLRNGQLVEKGSEEKGAKKLRTKNFATPYVSRIEAYESPVTGETISSWRQRDADMTAVGAVDPRDLSGIPFRERQERNARQQQRPDDDTFQWGAKSSD